MIHVDLIRWFYEKRWFGRTHYYYNMSADHTRPEKWVSMWVVDAAAAHRMYEEGRFGNNRMLKKYGDLHK